MAKNVAAKFLRSIFLDLNITPAKWDTMLRKHLTQPDSGIPDSAARRSSARSNINRALGRHEITWKTLRTALQALRPINIEYRLDLQWDEKLILPIPGPEVLEYSPQNRSDELRQMVQILMMKVGITPRTWDVLVERWLNDPKNRISSNPADRSTERNNIRKALIEKPSYTWQSFIRGLSILGVRSATLTVILTWSKSRKTYHAYSFKTGAKS